MSCPPEQASRQAMQSYFRELAPKYDFITRALSFGMDQGWKAAGVRRAALPDNARMLDLACGTGDFSSLVEQQYPGCRTFQSDLTLEMLRGAARRGLQLPVCADAHQLPFPDAVFDAVMVGYGLRNFPDYRIALAEISRILKPGGVLLALDFYLPPNRIYISLYLGYLWLQGAVWGLLLHGRPRAYTYIPDSIRNFVTMNSMTALMRSAGLGHVNTRRFLGGGIALHWAWKTPRRDPS